MHYIILINADKNSFKLKTQFKSWTINDVLYHLHVWNIAALLSLKNENEFKEFMQNFMEAVNLEILQESMRKFIR